MSDWTPLVTRTCTATAPLRVGVLASGSGSNLAALLAALQRDGACAEIVVVVTNVPEVRALTRAADAGVPGVCVPHKVDGAALPRERHEAQVAAVLDAHDVEVVVLAGYMRVLSAAFLDRYAERVVNVHPALLPSFPGMHGARQALEHGVRITGCTVHIVDAGVDTGPILAQGAVPVLDDDDEARLQARIQTVEHQLLPRVVVAFAAGQVGRDARGRLRARLDAVDADEGGPRGGVARAGV